MRILFIVKKQNLYSGHYTAVPSSGLFNSAKFVSDMVHDKLHFKSKIVVVEDNNDIDREVTAFKPKIVVIEALWVVPEKFAVLKKLHPHVEWIVRNHSNLPFVAQEGIAMDWFMRYMKIPKVSVACNEPRIRQELQALANAEGARTNVLYLPNYYPPQFTPRCHQIQSGRIDIGCFGAIRPLKNQLIQAVAAIEYAQSHGKQLFFHMNGSRIEGGGLPISHNLEGLFNNLPQHKLVTYPWMNRQAFLSVIRKMDVAMQVAFSETFNIVTADAVMSDVPVVVSPEIDWVDPMFQVDPTSSPSIVAGIGRALRAPTMWPGWHPNVNRLLARNALAVAAWRRDLATL
jgi:hypothetical protein